MLRKFDIANITIQNLKRLNEEKKNIIIQGFVKKVHKQSEVFFVHISDAFSNDQIQAVIPRDMVKKINVGTSLQIDGEWLKSLGKQQNFELKANDCKVYAVNENQPVPMSSDSLRKSLHTRPNSEVFSKILKLRSKINYLTHKYFYERNFTHIDTPLISLNDCEGAGEAFIVKANNDEDFFGDKEVYLPVSGQLHLEACAGPMTKVYTLSGAFRAEKSLTRQHMAEFRMLEVEIGFCDNVEMLCNMVEDYIRYLKNDLLENEEDIREIQKTFSDKNRKKSLIELIGDKQFPIVNYEECIEILKKLKKRTINNGFSKDEEFTLLKYFNSPLFITNFPSNQKPFYMKRFNINDNIYTKSFDFLSPFVGELAGGSIREDSVEELQKHGIKNIDWYIELRKNGYPISGGYGIGIDRLMQSMFAIASIKDTIPFPRYYKNCKC